jgi:hypothetical protein
VVGFGVTILKYYRGYWVILVMCNMVVVEGFINMVVVQ